jgi:secreted PhoX family phosphatase
MLAAMPGQTGDGGARTITNTVTPATGSPVSNMQATIVGKAATGATLRRFLVGPVECEVTGIDSTPDGRSLFINVQHPGEDARDPPTHQQLAGKPDRARAGRASALGDDRDHQK